jgi:TadE-like protein
MKTSSNKQRQKGLTTVEFSIVGATLFILLFAALEFSRLLYTFAVLHEGARRAVRLAAVCPIGSPNILRTVDFAGLPDFNPGNVRVQYLNANGFPTGNYNAISYVQVQIVGYFVPLSIPFINPTIPSPAFATTLPRESLGVSNTALTPCG